MRIFILAGAVFVWGADAKAQRTNDNAVTAAQDAFGVSVGSERIGIYNDREVRGFSPVTAGNVRIEGVYIDLQGQLNSSLAEGNTIRVGLSALSYPFPAPTGIVDYRLQSAGGVPGLSPSVTIGSFGSRSLEVEGFVPIVGDTLTFSGAAALRRNVDQPGKANRIFNFGLVPRWTPAEGVQVTPFLGYSRNREDIQPTVFVAGSFLPPELVDEAFGQRWTDQDRIQSNMGVLAKADLAEGLTLQSGVFRSKVKIIENYSDFYRNTTRDGLADHVINANPGQLRVATSGEVRLTMRRTTGRLNHTFHLMTRGRHGENRYGGSASAQLGKATVGVFREVAKPQFNFGPQTNDDIKQLTGGAGYEGILPGVGQLSIGVQKSKYEKSVLAPGFTPVSITTKPWLYNASGAIYATSALAIYGGYTRGMEENGVAPDVATNRGEPLPSAITSQRELGFRYALRPNFQIVGGVFDLKKPYFSLDSRNLFTELGSLTTRGVEMSLAGPVLPGLNIVAGAVIMDPKVTGEAVALGRVGARAVGQTRQLFRLNADYRFPFAPSFSIDAELEHFGPMTASVRPDPATGVQFQVPRRTSIDLGARYRFQIANSPALLRLQLSNLTDARGWEPTSSGGLQAEDPRRVQLELSADL